MSNLSEEKGNNKKENKTKAKVMIVEDEESLAQLYDHKLNDDFETIVANNAAEALKKLGPEYSYLVLDRRLPGMSGDKILEYLRDQAYDVSVIIVSAIDPDQDVIEHPYDEYLTKSVAGDELLDAINRVEKKNRLVALFQQYIRKAQTLALLESKVDMTAKDELVEIGVLQEEVAEIEAEFSDLVSDLGDSCVTDILCGINPEDIDC